MSTELITPEDYLKRHLNLNTLETKVNPFCIIYNGNPIGLGDLAREIHTSYKNYYNLILRIQTLASVTSAPKYEPPHGRSKLTTAICNHLKSITAESGLSPKKEKTL